MIDNKKLSIKKIFNLAIENQKKNNFQVAKDLYSQILRLNPTFHEVYNNLGLIFLAEGNNKEAKRFFKKAIQINPNLVNVQYNLGLVLQKMGDNEEAKNCYKKLIKINPDIPEAYNNLGVVNSNLGEFKEAIYNYDIAITKNKNFTNAKENLISSLTCLDSDNHNQIVFANKKKLNILNSIIHPYVTKNFNQWVKNQNSSYIIKESAILFESNTYQNLDKIIVVQSPLDLRIKRVCQRDGRTKEDVQNIIKNQMKDTEYIKNADYIITNDQELLLPKIIQLKEKLSNL